MNFFNSALGRNITFVRPAYFIISGISGIPNIKYYYVFLFFVYIVSVVGNTVVMAVIYLDHNLRTPKYIAVFNLAFVDLMGSSALVPKLLDIFMFNHQYISYNDCVSFMFFCFTFYSMQSLTLVALSVDRLIAIVDPLHYHMKVTHKFMLSLIAFFWIFVLILMMILVCLLTRLSFCKSVVINSYYCDHGPMYRLGCNDVTPSRAMGGFAPIVILWLPLMFILGSYCAIGYAILKTSTVSERMKAFKTSTAHLSLVAVFFLPILITFSIGSRIHPNIRIINLSLTSVFPPMLDPIIYVLQTKEIKESVKKVLKSKKQVQIAV
ncbi:olfactory receptor 52E8-like [Sphaeramia orbicularis]|uniref:Olfactory receptor 52E8-like n=1 Tax=Sphaeramia orbicularis TaxID=375764 RepID=A0A673BDL4_9TELE|nr:olfactory receptor 52E8-like [Sphaeramia orbicularis]